MGWATGTELMNKTIDIIYERVSDYDVRRKIYIDLIDAFGDLDWDTENECLGKDEAYDSAYLFYYPDDDDDEYFEENEVFFKEM